MPSGRMQFAYRRLRENIPGSQPQEINATLPAAFAAASTFAKCSGMRAWVSKLSTTLKSFAYSGVCFGRSVALPPQIIMTSILSFQAATSATEATVAPGVRIFTVCGSRLVNTATSSVSSFCFTAHSTPRPRLPYPMIPILTMVSHPPIGNCRSTWLACSQHIGYHRSLHL